MDKNCFNCEHYVRPSLSPPHICVECMRRKEPFSLWEAKSITNADKIRSMTDEELAELFKSPLFFNKPWCCLHENQCRHLDSKEFKCAVCLLDWLKQEATDD